MRLIKRETHIRALRAIVSKGLLCAQNPEKANKLHSYPNVVCPIGAVMNRGEAVLAKGQFCPFELKSMRIIEFEDRTFAAQLRFLHDRWWFFALASSHKKLCQEFQDDFFSLLNSGSIRPSLFVPAPIKVF